MKWLNAFLTDVLKKIAKAILNHIQFLGTRIVTVLTTILAFILTPLNYFLDWLIGVLTWATEQLSELSSLLSGLHFGDVQAYWLAFAPYFGLLDLFIPLGLLTSTAAILCVLWLLCTIIRIAIRCIPTAG